MRRRLIAYFERKSVTAPDDLVDETFNRIARRLAEEGNLTEGPPARYCYITAKYVFLEHLREPGAVPLPEAEPARTSYPFARESPAPEHERRLDCLDRCLNELSDKDRGLILEYYGSEQRTKVEHRQRLAARLGLSANALAIRASRIRGRLEACVTSCCGRNDMFSH